MKLNIGEILFIFIIITYSLINISQASAIGASPAKFQEFKYSGATTEEYILMVHNNAGHPTFAKVMVEGGMVDSTTCSECDSQGRFHLNSDEWKKLKIKVHFKPYDELTSFGKTSFRFKIVEILDPRFVSGLFGVTTTVIVSAPIEIPIPGLFVSVDSVNVPNIKKGFNTFLNSELTNKGVLEAENVLVKAVISDIKGNNLSTIKYDPISISPGETISLPKKTINSEKFPSGMYHVEVFANYDSSRKPSSKSTKFFIGGTDILLLNYTKVLERGKINRIDFEFQSIYPLPVHSVKAYFSAFNKNEPVLLPVIDFDKSFSSKKSYAYLDVPKNTTENELNTVLKMDYLFDGSPVTKEIPLSFKIIDPKPIKINDGSTTIIKKYVVFMSLLILIIIILFLIILSREKSKKRKSSTKKTISEDGNKKEKSKINNPENVKDTTVGANNEKEKNFDWTK